MSAFGEALAQAAQFLTQRQSADEQMTTQPTDPYAVQPSPGASGALAGLMSLMGGGGGGMPAGGGGGGGGIGPVSGNLRTVNGVTMIAPAIRSLAMAKRQLGLPVFGEVVSSYRTRAEQAALYQKYLNGTGNLAAPPGHSDHETGHAVDISSSFLSQNPELRRWLLDHGWTNNVGGEPWHWEYGT